MKKKKLYKPASNPNLRASGSQCEASHFISPPLRVAFASL